MVSDGREQQLHDQLRGLMLTGDGARSGTWESDNKLIDSLAASIAKHEAEGTLSQEEVAGDVFLTRTALWRNTRRIFGCNWRQLERKIGVNNKGR